MNDLAWDAESYQSRPGVTPYLIDAYENRRTPDYRAAMANSDSGWDPATLAFPVRVGEVIDIVWQQTNHEARHSYDYHPMHAHGERYWDLGAGLGQYDPTANERRFANYTPAQRDSTMLYSYSTGSQGKRSGGLGGGNRSTTSSAWRAWRIRVTDENVGAWIMHCHLLHHMIMGEYCRETPTHVPTAFS